MAIKGLTGRGAMLPCIGKLFKGAPKQTKKRTDGTEYQTFGAELDYWRFESDLPHVADAFREAFGDKPRVLPVYLPFRTSTENFEAWREAYTAGGLAHRCDGETCVLWFDPSVKPNGDYSSVAIPCPAKSMPPDKAKRDGCKPVARLQVIIPALNELGFVTMETHSLNDILHLDRALAAFEALRPQDGLRGIPFELSRFEKEISTPREGKRVRVKKWLVALRPLAQWSGQFLNAQYQAALASAAEPLQLEAGDVEEEDDSVIAGEIAPAIAPASERDVILAAMRATYEDNSSTGWERYEAEHLTPKSTDALRKMLTRWQEAALTKQQNADPLAAKRDEADDLLNRLADAGLTPAEIQKLQKGTVIEEADDKALTALIVCFKSALNELQETAKAA